MPKLADHTACISIRRSGRSFSTAGFSLIVASVEGKQLIHPTLILDAADASTMTVTAQTAELRLNPERQTLSILLTNGNIEVEEKATFSFADTFVQEISLTSIVEDSITAARPANQPFAKLPAETQDQRARIERIQQQLAVVAAYQMLSGDLQTLASTNWAACRGELNQAMTRLDRLKTEPWRRWANGFSCLCFALVGGPIAIRMRNSDLATTFATCFLPILGTYYPLFMFGFDRAKCGAYPPYAVWLANIIYLAVGIVLQRSVRRR